MNNTFYPQGYVKLTDKKTNKVLFEGHNMILQDGRNFIRDLFLNKLVSSEIYNEAVTDYSFDAICLGNSSEQTTLDYKGNLKNSDKCLVLSDSDSNQISVIDGNKLKISIIITEIINEQNFEGTYSELGIRLKRSNGEKMLFSRISFDPIAIESGSSVELEYYIYF